MCCLKYILDQEYAAQTVDAGRFVLRCRLRVPRGHENHRRGAVGLSTLLVMISSGILTNVASSSLRAPLCAGRAQSVILYVLRERSPVCRSLVGRALHHPPERYSNRYLATKHQGNQAVIDTYRWCMRCCTVLQDSATLYWDNPLGLGPFRVVAASYGHPRDPKLAISVRAQLQTRVVSMYHRTFKGVNFDG